MEAEERQAEGWQQEPAASQDEAPQEPAQDQAPPEQEAAAQEAEADGGAEEQAEGAEQQAGTGPEAAEEAAGPEAASQEQGPGSGQQADASGQEAEGAPDPRDEQLAALNARLLRLQADFDNYRRRTKGEKEQLGSYVTAQVVGKFLKVLDNFERAEASAVKQPEPESLLRGLSQIRRQFEVALKELGVAEIAALGQKFDPNIHEAVLRGQNPEVADETIDLVLEKGYQLGDKVIRHSKVRVITND